MTSFMSKKKKYKFQVEICLEELLEVPFVSAVLFAKLRLLDGGSFQDYSSRQEVTDHKVSWNGKYSFPCKMMANASTGVMEKCILRISIRKESKGGRSFTKLGFVDLNLAEYAGAGLIHKKALLEGYDARHRQDNSMLKFCIQLNMVSGDILFKVPSPSLKHKQLTTDEASADQRSDEFSSGSLPGSINSGSSGFGSLPKKRVPLPTELVIGQTLPESSHMTVTTPFEPPVNELSLPVASQEQSNEHPSTGPIQEPGHSRNSSNTSQMSKASGYSSTSHSRQSSSGDSAAGHIRNASQHESLRRPPSKFHRTYTFPKYRINIPTTIMSESPRPQNLDLTDSSDGFHTPRGGVSTPEYGSATNGEVEEFYTPQSDFASPRENSNSPVTDLTTPRNFRKDKSFQNTNNNDVGDVFKTPDGCFSANTNIFDNNFNTLQKSASSSVIERIKISLPVQSRLSLTKANHDDKTTDEKVDIRNKISYFEKRSQPSHNPNYNFKRVGEGVIRSKSDFVIPKLAPNPPPSDRNTFSNRIAAFLTPRMSRKSIGAHSTPRKSSDMDLIPLTNPLSKEDSRAVSMGNLKYGNDGYLNVYGSICNRLHRKMILDGPSGTKLTPYDSPPEVHGEEDNAFLEEAQRRSSTTIPLNPSSGSLQTNSDTGSLDRAKAAYERRKKNQNAQDEPGSGVPDRVGVTRVNPEDFIADLLKSTNLEQPDDSAETSGLQLFIAKDGTASLGNHEVKSQMSTGVNTFKQVVMDNR